MIPSKSRKRVRAAALALMLVALAAPDAGGQAAKPAAPVIQPDAARQRELERDAAINLSLAKKSIQDDAFYNAKVALNVWKISAVEAGNFDRKLYEDLRKQLYEKSIRDNLRCIDVAVAHRDAADANLCLKIYRLHAQEINAFDPKRYEDLRARVSGIRKKEK
ncbi:MAG: hypothetical protein MUC33_03310 [Desulfobacterales bacterium]|jgi:hypothetical protein|nr:hypothetical protein [Desulfobacterales bacterium]